MHKTVFEIKTQVPFRLDFTVWVLRRREKNIVDGWDGQFYQRVLEIDGQLVAVKAQQAGAKSAPKIKVELTAKSEISAKAQLKIEKIISKMLGLNINLKLFYLIASKNPIVSELALKFYGMRPTRYPTVFEALINAVACQQVSLDAGIAILNRLIKNYGASMKVDGCTHYAFPTPENLINISDEEFKQVGFSRQKAKTIRNIALGVVNNGIALEKLEDLNNPMALEYLRSFHGIGRWSAEYVLLRGLGRLDVFPGDDVGGQNNLQKLFGLSSRPGYDQSKFQVNKFHPYEGLIYFYMLLNKLYKNGAV